LTLKARRLRVRRIRITRPSNRWSGRGEEREGEGEGDGVGEGEGRGGRQKEFLCFIATKREKQSGENTCNRPVNSQICFVHRSIALISPQKQKQKLPHTCEYKRR